MVAILGLFAVVFAIVYLHDRKQRMAGWLALAYLSGLAAFLVDISRSALDPIQSDIAAKTLFWCFSLAFSLALFDRFKTLYPTVKLGVIIGTGAGALWWFSFGDPDIIMRSTFSSITAGLLISTTLPTLWKRRSGLLDTILLGLIAILSAIYFLRPYLIYSVLDAAHTIGTYQNSAYAMLLHGSSAIAALACGVTLLIVLGHDIILKYQRETTIDPLTGLMNRRGLDQFITKELNKKGVDDCAVMIVDLDDFKQVNDLFGHETGDHVLKRAASILQRVTGNLGKVARIGGEEFVILLDELSSEDRLVVAQHLRLSVGMIVHPEIGPEDRVTASFGVALIFKGESFAMALRRADSALYEAKSDGRNCVVEASNDNSFTKIRYIERY
ncbi:MAG: GGDEF domain-containing protein [Parasphingorhabdus sp.]